VHLKHLDQSISMPSAEFLKSASRLWKEYQVKILCLN